MPFVPSKKIQKEATKIVKAITGKRIYRRKKNYGKKTHVQKPGPSYFGFRGILAQYYDAKLKMVVNGRLTSNDPETTSTYFWLNSLWEPFKGTSDHRPFTYDQYALLYQNYIVKATDVNIKVCLTENTATQCDFFVTICDDSYDPASYQGNEIMERNIAKKRLFLTGFQTGQKSCRFKQDLHGIFGVTKSQYMNELDDYSSKVGASPPYNAVMDIILSPIVATNPISCDYTVEIIYWARFFNPVFLPNSPPVAP